MVFFVCQVTHLVIKRPQFFQFKPGDYVFINIPVIAKYEWHPFTISSAPEQSGTPHTLSTETVLIGSAGPRLLDALSGISVRWTAVESELYVTHEVTFLVKKTRRFHLLTLRTMS